MFVRGKLPRVTLAALLSDSEDEELEEELSSKEVSDELEGVGARLDDFAFFLGGGTGMLELSATKSGPSSSLTFWFVDENFTL